MVKKRGLHRRFWGLTRCQIGLRKRFSRWCKALMRGMKRSKRWWKKYISKYIKKLRVLIHKEIFIVDKLKIQRSIPSFNNYKEDIPRMGFWGELMKSRRSKNRLIGEIILMLLALLSSKARVDHAGLSRQLPSLRVLTLYKLENPTKCQSSK